MSKKMMTGEDFEALSAAEKEKIFRDLERKGPEQLLKESTALSSEQRAAWANAQRKMGRPKVGQGVKVVSISIEKGLLAEVDWVANKLGVKRAQYVAQALRRELATRRRK